MPYWENNERLEFLGDSVLNMLVTEYLYSTYPHSRRAIFQYKSIVSGHALAKSVQDWDLARICIGEVRGGGQPLQGKSARGCVRGGDRRGLSGRRTRYAANFAEESFPHIKRASSRVGFKNFKSLLLEFRRARNQTPPEYAVVEESGPSIEDVQERSCFWTARSTARARAFRRRAEQEAAHVALDRLVKEEGRAEGRGESGEGRREGFKVRCGSLPRRKSGDRCKFLRGLALVTLAAVAVFSLSACKGTAEARRGAPLPGCARGVPGCRRAKVRSGRGYGRGRLRHAQPVGSGCLKSFNMWDYNSFPQG